MKLNPTWPAPTPRVMIFCQDSTTAMGKIVLGRVMVVLGVIGALGILKSFTLTSLVFDAVLLVGGWKLATSQPAQPLFPVPPVPPGFRPTDWHKNIALDMNAGLVWLQDQSGRARVFRKSDILQWEVRSQKVSPASISGDPTAFGQTVHLRNHIRITTTDADHRLYIVKFDAYGATFSAELNHRDANHWANWLGDFVRS